LTKVNKKKVEEKEVKKSHPFRRKWDKEFYERKAKEREEGEEIEPGTLLQLSLLSSSLFWPGRGDLHASF